MYLHRITDQVDIGHNIEYRKTDETVCDTGIKRKLRNLLGYNRRVDI